MLIICNLFGRKGKTKAIYEATVICPVDQKMDTIPLELTLEELEEAYLPLADKIFRCEKCFRETEILDTAVTKKQVNIFVSCKEHGRLIIRELSPGIYDKIKFAWDMKDVKEEKERTY